MSVTVVVCKRARCEAADALLGRGHHCELGQVSMASPDWLVTISVRREDVFEQLRAEHQKRQFIPGLEVRVWSRRIQDRLDGARRLDEP